jgi:wobble nucleotide-excising tRNase
MAEKFTGEIQSIALDDASYKGTGVTITPTYINYFFGNNGTGKSTLAKAIKSGLGITYAPGKSAADYLPLVFNQDYIDANMHSYHNLPGVFTINEINVAIQQQIDTKTDEQVAAKKAQTDAMAEKKKKEDQKEALVKQLHKDCWDKTADLRATFDATQGGKKKSKQFTEEVMRHTAVEQDLEELKRMYDSVYSDTAKSYNRFSEIADTTALDQLAGIEILGVAIVNTANTPFADFLKEVGSTEWVRQGHSEFHAKAGDRCPYCSRTFESDFEAVLAASFDTQYQTNLDRLNAFLDAYKAKANELFVPLSRTPAELYPAIDINPYTDKLEALKATIAANIGLIKEKIAEPARAVTLDDTAPLFEELATIIAGFNNLIDANNAIVSAGPKKKAECTKAVFDHMAFVLKDILAAYKRSDKALDTEIATQQSIMDTQRSVLAQLKEELRVLNSQTVETETAMKNINTMLRDSGFEGFKVQAHADGSATTARNYEVVRTETGEVATNLSEGEKNFIAFLYFQQRVFGNDTAEGDPREKIVVIDDPVSSMDSSALFIVSSMVRKMVEICRNNADNRNAVVPGNFIKQIFILTHNAYFHREVTYAYASRWDFVSFYLIRKVNNKSIIRLCDATDPNCPTARMNINPVKNSYAALWDEYKELRSTVPLMNVIRRILEYYFLQLCGYEGNDLRKCILEDNKDSFTHDEYGAEDYSKYDLAASMLSYISATSIGVNDGINYVDEIIDPELCRETFQMIFHHMNQDQHYNMMMGIS